MNESVETYQTNKLPVDLAEIAFDFAEAVQEASTMWPTLVPLKILSTLTTILGAGSEIDEIIGASKEALPNSTDAMRPEAVLNGALALNQKQSKRINDLIGMVVWYMQQHTHNQGAPLAKPAP